METLRTLAEIAVGFAGFASIVVAFRRQSDSWRAVDAHLYRNMLTNSLNACWLALIPPVLVEFQPPADTLWFSCSAVMLVYVIFRTLLVFVFGRETSTAKQVWAGRSGTTIAVLGLANVFLQTSNLVGTPFGTGPGPYVAGVALFLASAGLSFLRLLELPIEDRLDS